MTGISRGLAVVSLVALAATVTVSAGDVSNLSSNRWVADGRVRDAVAQGDVVYLAGTFTRIGSRTGPLAFLDPVTLEPMPGPEVTGGHIVALERDGVGGYFIAGGFAAVGGRPQSGVARLTATGSLDPAFAPTGITDVRAMVVSGDRLFVSVGSLPSGAPSIIALDRVTGATLSWTPARSGIFGRLFVLPNGNVVGTLPYGSQTLPPTSLEFDRASGAFVDFWHHIPHLTLDADTVIGSVGHTIVRIDVHTRATTVVASTTSTCATTSATCFTMTLEAGTLFFTGAFTAVNGVPRQGAAAVEVTTGRLLPWQPPVLPSYVPQGGVHVGGGQVYVQYEGEEGMSTTLVGCAPDSGAATGVRGWLLGGTAASVIVESGRIVAGGLFRGAGGVARAGLAAVRWPDGRPTEWQPVVGMTPYKLAVLGRRVFVAGLQGHDHGPGWIREVDAATGVVAPWAVPVDDTVRAMHAQAPRLFLAGDFATVAGLPRRTLASLDVSGPEPVLESWAPAVSSTQGSFGVVESLDVSPQVVLIAGTMTDVGGQPRAGVAALDPTTGTPLGWAPQIGSQYPPGHGYFAEIAASRVWVSGVIASVDGQPRAGVAAFDLQGVLTPWSPQQPDYGRTLNAAEQRATYFEGRSYAGIGYAVDASDGSLAAFSPIFDTNTIAGAWSPAPGFGLVRHSLADWGFLLFPRVDLLQPVTGLVAAISGHAVTLSWSAVSGADTYVIEGGSTAGAQDLGRLEVGASTTTLTVSVPNGRYYVRVRARSVAGTSAVSDDLLIVVGADACTAPPAPPTALRAEAAGSRVRLDWHLPPGLVLGTIIEASIDAGGAYVEVARTPGATLQFETAAPPGRYVARVRAANACGVSTPSAPVAVVLTSSVSPPSSPENLQARVGADRTVTLSWQAPPGLPTAYLVAAGSEPGWSDLGVAVVTETTVVVANVPPRTYHVRVLAQNEGGVSAPSSEVVVIVP